jgi:hypothetical protein
VLSGVRAWAAGATPSAAIPATTAAATANLVLMTIAFSLRVPALSIEEKRRSGSIR